SRAHRRPLNRGLAQAQLCDDLSWSPEPMTPAQLEQPFDDLRRHRVGVRLGSTRLVFQALQTASFVPRAPLVADLAADPEGAAELALRPIAVLIEPGSDELHSFLFHTGLLPRHRATSRLPS